MKGHCEKKDISYVFGGWDQELDTFCAVSMG